MSVFEEKFNDFYFGKEWRNLKNKEYISDEALGLCFKIRDRVCIIGLFAGMILAFEFLWVVRIVLN